MIRSPRNARLGRWALVVGIIAAIGLIVCACLWLAPSSTRRSAFDEWLAESVLAGEVLVYSHADPSHWTAVRKKDPDELHIAVVHFHPSGYFSNMVCALNVSAVAATTSGWAQPPTSLTGFFDDSTPPNEWSYSVRATPGTPLTIQLNESRSLSLGTGLNWSRQIDLQW